MRRRQLAAVGVVLALLVAGCAGVGGPSTDATTTTTTAPTTETTETTETTTTTDRFVATDDRLVLENRNDSALSFTVRLEPFDDGETVVRNVTVEPDGTVDLTDTFDREEDYVLTMSPEGTDGVVFERRAYRYEKYTLALTSPTGVTVANHTAIG